MNRDPEVPAGFQDADIEMSELAAAAADARAARKAGRCPHGYVQKNVGVHWRGPADAPRGAVWCFDCERLFTGPEAQAIYPY